MRCFCVVVGWIGLAALSVSSGASAEITIAEDGKSLSANCERLERVFAPFAIPNIKGKPWVAVDIGPANYSWEHRGWLIEENPQVLMLVDLEGDTQRLRKPKPDEVRPKIKEQPGGGFNYSDIQEADRSVAWKVMPADYLAEIKTFLTNGLPSMEDTGGRGLINPYYALADRVVDAARLALFTRQLGETNLAADLYRLAVAGHRKHAERYADEKTSSLHLFVAQELGFSLSLGAKSMAHGGTPRDELLKRWQLVAAIPHHKYRGEAQRMVQHYESLLEEDRRWIEPQEGEVAKMPVERQVAYWLYHLRDLDVGQNMQPGSCRIFSFSIRQVYVTDPDIPHPAKELEKLGMAAIPQVIAHLDDERPSRCKGYWRFYSPEGHHLLSYGDCCQQIFERITRHSIFEAGKYPSEAGESRICKEKAEKWWKQYQTKGEKQVLIEGVAAGDRDSCWHADALIEKYPEAALAPIIRGARNSKEAWMRTNLIYATSQLKGEQAVSFLREETSGPYLQSRVAAAFALAVRGNQAGIQALVHEWKQLSVKKPNDHDYRDSIDQLTRGLCQSSNPAALRALGEEMFFHEKRTVSKIIEQLETLEKDLCDRPLTPEAEAILEGVLVKVLRNSTQEDDYCLRNGDDLGEPHLADRAAAALAHRWMQPTLFDIEAPLQVRQRQRVAVENVWLTKRGQEPKAIPKPRIVTPAAPQAIDPILKAALDAKSSKERVPVLHSLEKLGLAALPAVRKTVDSLPENHPARNDLQSLATRLAFVVGEVHFTAGSVQPDNETRARFEALRGKQLTAVIFGDLFRTTASKLPMNVRGIKILSERIPNDTGVYLEVTLFPRESKNAEKETNARYGYDMLVDKQRVGGVSGSYGSFEPTDLFNRIDWQGLANALPLIFHSAPNEYAFARAYFAECR